MPRVDSVSLKNASSSNDVPGVVIAKPYQGVLPPLAVTISSVSFSKKSEDFGCLESGHRAGPGVRDLAFDSVGVIVGASILDFGLHSAGVGTHGLVREGAYVLVSEGAHASGSKLANYQITGIGVATSPHVSFKMVDLNLVSNQGLVALTSKNKGVISNSHPILQRNSSPSFA
ncbi:hypothetical protein PanWU01x14_329990 [Parasponia andersonii]|uniref:Uncharacterized protein n=1 Tax=Parasponia andersonii TaxID=3476 RepID=A0A2P5AI65_PARAD|nr:hypothetical protein PanWU01x14_329990 [Parasponia andersonii]